MTQKEQFQKKIFSNYTANESDSVLYVDTTSQPITIFIDTPLRNDKLIIEDLGNAATNNITIRSKQLINNSNSFVISTNYSVSELKYSSQTNKYTLTDLGSNSDELVNRIVVNQDNFLTTICGVIDSSKQYVLDGIIDLGSNQITVPPTGITILGLSFDITSFV